MKIKPTGNQVIVRRRPHAETVKIGSIEVPGTALGKVGEAEVLAVGPGAIGAPVPDPTGRVRWKVDADGRVLRRGKARQVLDVEIGDRVLIGEMFGIRIWPDDVPRPEGSDKLDFVIVRREDWAELVGDDDGSSQIPEVLFLEEELIMLKF